MAGFYDMADEQYLPYMAQVAPDTPGSYYAALTGGDPRLLQAIYAPNTKYAPDIKAKGSVGREAISAGGRAALAGVDEMMKQPTTQMMGNVAVGLRSSPMQSIAKAAVAGADTVRIGKQDEARRSAEADAAQTMAKGMRKEYDDYQGLKRKQAAYLTAQNIAVADREAVNDLVKQEAEVLQPIDDLIALGGLGTDRDAGKYVAGKGSALEGGDQRAAFRTIAKKWDIDTKKFASYGTAAEQAQYLLKQIPNRQAVSQAMGVRYLMDNGYSALDAQNIVRREPAIGEGVLEQFGMTLVNSLSPIENKKPKGETNTRGTSNNKTLSGLMYGGQMYGQ